MIPAPILAEAREAFWTADNTRAALDAYEAVLSRHWPAAAGMREALEFIAEEHDAGRHDGLPEPCPAHDADTMWATARAALATSAPSDARLREALAVPDVWPDTERDGMAAAFKAADGKHGHYETLFAVAAWLLRHRASRLTLSIPAPAAVVRVVRVAVAGDHDGTQEAWLIDEDRTIQDVWDGAHAAGYPIRLCIAEIPVPIREVPTVQASVTGAGT